jgi:FixJ family two-component response regulator
VSAGAWEEEKKTILGDGADDFIRKPFREEHLLDAWKLPRHQIRTKRMTPRDEAKLSPQETQGHLDRTHDSSHGTDQ